MSRIGFILRKRRPQHCFATRGEINRVRILGTCVLFCFCRDQLVAQSISQPRHHLILQLEEVGYVFLEAVSPEMRAGLAIDELRVDTDMVLVALHRAFENIADAQFLADLRAGATIVGGCDRL